MADMSLLEVRAFAGKRYRCDVRQAVACFLIDRPCPKRRTSGDPTCRYVPDEKAAYPLRPAEVSPSPARCSEVFFGARVALQPQTTSAIMRARKIPSSAMPFLRRPAWGGIKSCAVTLAA